MPDGYRTIIAGSRSLHAEHVDAAMKSCPWVDDIAEVVSGCARGVDRYGELWAMERDIHVKLFPADWNRYGRSAGYRRNVEMAEYANSCVVVWDEKSAGSKHMIDIAKNRKLELIIWTPQLSIPHSAPRWS